jgi:excisionase family DNA binding protein
LDVLADNDAALTTKAGAVHVGATITIALELRVSPYTSPSGIPVEHWLTTAQATWALGITTNGIRQAIRRGRLPATKRAGMWLLRRADVAQYGARSREIYWGCMARYDDDYRVLRARLGWSRETAGLLQLLNNQRPHGRAELQAALDRVWTLLPPDESLADCRAALRRIVAAYQVGPHPTLLLPSRPRRTA